MTITVPLLLAATQLVQASKDLMAELQTNDLRECGLVLQVAGLSIRLAGACAALEADTFETGELRARLDRLEVYAREPRRMIPPELGRHRLGEQLAAVSNALDTSLDTLELFHDLEAARE